MGKKDILDRARVDGWCAVDSLVAEGGLEQLRAASAPGQLSWDEPAISAGAFECAFPREPATHRDAYYRAYDAAANAYAAELLKEDRDGRTVQEESRR
jgi:hypothetical protein